MDSIGLQIIKVARSLPADQRNRLLSVFKVGRDWSQYSETFAKEAIVSYIEKHPEAQRGLLKKAKSAMIEIAKTMGPMPHKTAAVTWGPHAAEEIVDEFLMDADDTKFQILDENGLPGFSKYFMDMVGSKIKNMKVHGEDLRITRSKATIVNNFVHGNAEVMGAYLGDTHWPDERVMDAIHATMEKTGATVREIAMGRHPKNEKRSYFEFSAEWAFRTSGVIVNALSRQKLENLAMAILQEVNL